MTGRARELARAIEQEYRRYRIETAMAPGREPIFAHLPSVAQADGLRLES